jgi:uncharacterized protein
MSTRLTSSKMSEPWYRSPMLWFALSLPALTVVAGVATYRIAASDSNDAEPDVVRRVAQMQTLDLAADEAAANRDLIADASIDPATGKVSVRIDAIAPSERLLLRLSHTTRAKLDQSIALTPDLSGNWVGWLSQERQGAYALSLTSIDAHWRLVGRLEARASQVRLLPLLRQNHE